MGKEQNTKLTGFESDPSDDKYMDNLTILADLSQGTTDAIPIKVKPGVFSRLEETLNNKGFTTKQVATGIFVVGVAVGIGMAAKKAIEHKREMERPMTDEEFENLKGVVERNYEDVYRYLSFGLAGQPENAEDLSQKVFLRAIQSYRSFKPKEDLEDPEKSWLLRIAHNTLANFYRDEGRKLKKTIELYKEDDEGEEQELVLVDPLYSSLHSIEEVTEEPSEEVNQLRIGIHALSEDAKLLLYLKHVEGLDNKESGYVLGRTEGAIKSLYSRSLEKLRGGLDKEGNL